MIVLIYYNNFYVLVLQITICFIKRVCFEHEK